jgi:hypothetical protein
VAYFKLLFRHMADGGQEQKTRNLSAYSHAKRSLFLECVSGCQKNFRSAKVQTNASTGIRIASYVRMNERTNTTGPSAGLHYGVSMWG